MKHVIFTLTTLLFTTQIATAQIPPAQLADRAKAVLATIDGEIAVTGLKAPVEVLRDRWGVPHIYAKNSDDLFFAQGFVAAQDRLFQIDLWRRIALGETADILGKAGIEGDTFARLIRYRGDMDAEWRSYSADTKQIATAFTNGINAYIKHSAKKLPIEFQILGHQPKLWQPEDVLGRMSGIIMSRNFSDEVLRAHLVDKLGLATARMLMPTDPRKDAVPVFDMMGIDSRILKGFQAASKNIQFPVIQTESNNWAISGDKSASGKPMLASDPHRALGLPALRNIVHLNAPGWNVIGAGEPGLPGVALGHNEKIAWGITIVGTDQADIYVEETDPENPTNYKVAGKWEPMKVVHEEIHVRGQNAYHMAELRFTRTGPVLYQDAKLNRAYVLKWAGADPGGAAYLPALAVSRVRNHKEFLNALERWKIPSLNFMYADVEGNIAWVAAAATPIRPKHDGLLPVPANAGYDWKGYLKVKDLPQDFNPESGWLATANHNIVPKDFPNPIAYEFAPPYRYLRVKANLEVKKKFTLDDFQKIQHDDVSIPGPRLARLLGNVKFSDPVVEKYAKILRSWDGKLARDSQGGVLYALWLTELQQAVFARVVPKELVKEIASKSGVTVLLQTLEQPDARWFGKDATPTRNAILTTTFEQAVKQATTRFPRLEDMRWGSLHTATFRHPLASGNHLYEKLLNVGPFERTGDANTPNNTRYDDAYRQIHGATYRHVFDLADWDKGVATSAPGQSGQFGSPHYADLAPLWANGEYFPLAYSRKMVESVTKNRLILKSGN